MIQDKTLSMLGLAKRAGKIKDGAFLAEKSVTGCKARLVILARDASSNTKKKFADKCRHRGIPIREYSDMDSIGASVGGGPRSVVSIEDDGFANAVLEKIRQQEDESGAFTDPVAADAVPAGPGRNETG